MEFWGVEVKAGKPLTVTPEMGKIVHISHAALGEGKREKGGENIPLRVKINDKKLVVGSLSAENFPQLSFELLFEKEFELSHDWKNGSVYFCGYTAPENIYEGDDDGEFDSEDDLEEMPEPLAENGKVKKKVEEVKPVSTTGKAAKPESSAKPKVTVVEPKKEESDSDDDSEVSLDDDEDMMEADSDDISGDDDSEDDGDSDDSDEETPTPKKSVDKKRPNGSASKTSISAKKSKVESAQNTDGKKGVPVATPHPSKKAEKSPTTNKQTPKSDAKISCNSCPKTFTSDGALQSHTKAKHAAK